jgi:predicted RNase H-like HicB family nuclease
MRAYFAVVIQDPDMGFSASFPDFPGCVATGSTFEEARVVAGRALAERIAEVERGGEPAPKPSSLDAIVNGEDEHCGAAIIVRAAEA